MGGIDTPGMGAEATGTSPPVIQQPVSFDSVLSGTLKKNYAIKKLESK